MTANQLKYAELMQTKARDAWNRAVSEGTLQENVRHNVQSEQIAREGNQINWFNAQSNRMNADSNRMNAQTNAINAQTNIRNAATNERNAATNERNATSNERNASANEMNAASNRMNAFTNQYNASINLMNAQTAQRRAATEYQAMLNNYEIQSRQTAVQEGNAEVQRFLWSTQADTSWSQMRLNWEKEKTESSQRSLLDQQAKTQGYLQDKYKAETSTTKKLGWKYENEAATQVYKKIETYADALLKAAQADKVQAESQWAGAKAFSEAFNNLTSPFLSYGYRNAKVPTSSVKIPKGKEWNVIFSNAVGK